MKVIYTEQAYVSLEETSQFLLNDLGWSVERVAKLIGRILDKADSLEFTHNHYQEEEYLDHLRKGYRRVIEGHFKIIYRVEAEFVFITDIFDTRQDPSKMKG